MNNYVINDEQIQQIVGILDNVAKSEGLSLRGSQALIEHVIKPLTSLPQITINTPTPTEEESTNE